MLKSIGWIGAGRIDATSKVGFVWVEPTVATDATRITAAMQGAFMPVKTGMPQNGYRQM
jgi:hypothetical protein